MDIQTSIRLPNSGILAIDCDCLLADNGCAVKAMANDKTAIICGGLDTIQAIIACCCVYNHPRMIVQDIGDETTMAVYNLDGDIHIQINGADTVAAKGNSVSLTILNAQSQVVAQALIALCAVALNDD